MMSQDEELISRSLHRLAEYAEPYRGTAARAVRTEQRRALMPILAAAAVAALLGTSALLAQRLDDEPSGPTSAGSHSAVSSAPVGSPTNQERQMKLDAVTSWSTESYADCSTWRPTGQDVVVEVDRLDAECLSKAPRETTTVISAPYEDEAPFGVTWTETTQPWRTVGGHEVRRLASGPLAEISSRYVDAIVCASCNQVFLVLGPDPERVRSVVESARTSP